MEFRLAVDQHDATICQEIGRAAGQTDWSIEHRNDGGDMVLTLPDGVLTEEQFEAVVKAHVPPSEVPPAPSPDETLVGELRQATTLPKIKAALIKRFGGE